MPENTRDIDLILASHNELMFEKAQDNAGVAVWKSSRFLAAVFITFFLESISWEIYLMTVLYEGQDLVTKK
jgi:hypothetical protein